MINEIVKNSKINLTDDMLKLMEHIDEIKKEFKDILNKYSKEFSETDKRQQDILHYIEFKKVSSVGAYRLLKELNKVRQQRRRAEDIIDLLNRIGRQHTFNNDINTSMILNSKNQSMEKRKYSARYYTEINLNNIVNNKGGNNNEVC